MGSFESAVPCPTSPRLAVSPTPGYPTDVEASHITTPALPGAIVLLLKRELDEGRPLRCMFIELTPGKALRHWQDVGDMIRAADAMEQSPRHVDAAANL